MRRPRPDNAEAIGSDSFLDVVTNIVGILIILVMVVGMRSKNVPLDDSAPGAELDAAADADIDTLAARAAGVQQDIFRLAGHAESVKQELRLQEGGRNHLAVLVTVAEKNLNERKATLDSKRQQQFAAHLQLASALAELGKLNRDIESATTARRPAIEVKAFHTPISKTVYNTEIHFQLSGGHVAYIPIEELFELAREETRSHMTRVSELSDRVMTVGPKQGFEMRYTVDVVINQRQGQMAIRSKEWQVIPLLTRLGEATHEALRDDSNLRRILARYSPDETTITVWTYPDSFGDYRILNEELHRLGYATAGRPLPKGFPIGGSPQGSKSAAQ